MENLPQGPVLSNAGGREMKIYNISGINFDCKIGNSTA
jgi:hypothetical protein